MARAARRTLRGPVAFLGDALTAAGYRLGGAEVFSPPPERVAATFRELLEEHALVLVSAGAAGRIPAAELGAATAAAAPPVVVVPELRGRAPLRDLVEELRRDLGIEP